MRIFVRVIFFVSICLRSFADFSCPSSTSSELQNLRSSSQEILKQAHINFASENTFEFCRRNVILRFLNSKKATPPNCERMTLTELEHAADQFISDDIDPMANIKKKDLFDNWNLALMSTEKSRKLLNSLRDHTLKKDLPDDYFESLNAKSPEEDIKEKLARIVTNNRFSSMQTSDDPGEVERKKRLRIGNAEMIAACLLNNPTQFNDCRKSLKIINENMQPFDIDQLRTTNANAWVRVYSSDEQHDQGLINAAAKLQKKLRTKNFSPQDNIFDDLVSSLKESGLKASEAENYAWDVMGAISSHGANTELAIDSLETYNQKTNKFRSVSPKGQALSYIAKAMLTLDYEKLKKNQPLYSIPTSVKSTCDVGKPYHFWMSAYLARDLVQAHGVSQEAAMKATYLVAQAYQVNRDLGIAAPGRNAAGGIFSKEAYDPVHQVIRADLAYQATGAYFGSLYKDSSAAPLSLDRTLTTLLEKSSVKSALSREEGSSLTTPMKLWRFNSIFSPSSALDYLNKK